MISLSSVSKSFGSQLLFKNISFTLQEGDRVGLVGPNGAGKSTLLKILNNEEMPGEGSISKRQGLKIGYASQSPEFPALTVEQVLTGEKCDCHETETRARILLGKGLFQDFSEQANTLSGGWKKRLDILRSLMNEPDLLLLDEPTNHLDLEGILWLEKFLERQRLSYLIVSHDRTFLENVCNKIIELNSCFPEGVFICKGGLSIYNELRAAYVQNKEQEERVLNAQVKNEVDWLRRSPKARTTKSVARIQKAHEMIDSLEDIQRRNRVKRAEIDFVAAERETRKLITAKNLSKSLGGKELFRGVDLLLSPGTRLGIVGENGTGKTTLLKILAGEIKADQGTVKYADELKLVYFDQYREKIPPGITLREALSPNSEYVDYHGQKVHVHGWAEKFLFSRHRLNLPVECLSGGERARILIARLMLKPADVLFLDEPTNDLDIPTLEVIEESLKQFVGAVVMISHDRSLMDRLCTEILGLGRGCEHQIFPDYSQWWAASQPKKEKVVVEKVVEKVERQRKLSYNEKRELEGMEEKILLLEQEVEALRKKLDQESDAAKSLELYRTLAEKEALVEKLFTRWHELENATQ